jgi:malonate transporter and related proteins
MVRGPIGVILSVTLPFFALILFGYIAASRGWVPTEAVPAFNGFLLYFAVPAMLFRFAANTPFEQLLNGRFALAWATSGIAVVLIVTYASVRLLRVRLRDAAFYGLAGGVGNLGFMGVPMLVALLGDGAAAAPILAIALDTIVVGSVGLALAEMSGATRKGWRDDVRDAAVRLFLNPFVIAMLLGAAFSAFEWTLPTPAASIVKLLADAAGPCALFAIGVSLVRPDVPLKSPALALPIAAKLLLHPLIVWVAMWAFRVDPFTTLVAVLGAALPSAGWIFIFATRYEADAGRVSAIILLTTALAFVTFSSLLWLLGVGS